MIGGLLYHSEEYVAFWNFVVAYEKLELRDIYLPSTIIELYIVHRSTRFIKTYTNYGIIVDEFRTLTL